MTTATTQRSGLPAALAEQLADWVELRSEANRSGRHVVAVNHRDHRATVLDQDDLQAFVGVNNNAEAARAAEVLEHLHSNGFLRHSDEQVAVEEDGGFLRTLAITWAGADGWVRRLHSAGLRFLFHPIGIVAQVVLGFAGTVAIVRSLSSGGEVIWVAEPWMVPALLAVDVVAIAVHELGHALVVIHHGRTVKSAGFVLHLGSPALFVETVDGLLLDRRTRVVQALAGPWAEWLFTGAVALAASTIGSAAVQVVLLRFIAVNVIGVAVNLLPFVGLDGSWVLSDLTREPDLVSRARCAAGEFRVGVRRPSTLGWLAWGGLNGLVAAALLGLSVAFWYQRFASTVLAAVSFHPLTALATAAVLSLLCRPVAAKAWPGITRRCSTVAGLVGRIRFRIERRWRVAAINELVAHPALAGFDERALGAAAGLLQRHRRRPADLDGPSVTLGGATYTICANDLARVRARAPLSAGC